MRFAATFLASCALLAVCPDLLGAADGPPALSHNPFSRPPSEVLRVERSIVGRNDGSGPTPALLATMVSSTTRLANVAGRILKPGDEVEGYKLIAIHEEFAVFEKDGRSITVYVKPHAAEEND